ncbi:MAG: hypothetical protein BGO54_12110 [Sphingobacteriales bacterium 46-32]|nr:MAG: hypothetical protein BGO54_12110 [Sphingobacteriales bacterium 46-32]
MNNPERGGLRGLHKAVWPYWLFLRQLLRIAHRVRATAHAGYDQCFYPKEPAQRGKPAMGGARILPPGITEYLL